MTDLAQAQYTACRLYFMIRMLQEERIAPGAFIVDWALDSLTSTSVPIELYGDAFLDHEKMIGDTNEHNTD